MKVLFCGLGAIGSNLIVQMMKQYPDFEYIGLDYDRVEERNIRTQAYFLEHVGIPKVNALPIVVARSLRKLKYSPLNHKLTEKYNLEHLISKDLKDILIIDCFDNTQARKLITKKYKKADVLHVGFSPFYTAEIMWDKDYDVPNDVDPSKNDICSMTDATAFINFVVSYTMFVISDFITHKKQKSFLITGKYLIKSI